MAERFWGALVETCGVGLLSGLILSKVSEDILSGEGVLYVVGLVFYFFGRFGSSLAEK